MKSCPTCTGKNCYHVKSMVKKSKDGKGGPGLLQAGATNAIPGATPPMPPSAPMMPGMGVAAGPSTLMPQQAAQIAQMGRGAMPPVPPPVPVRPPKISNKPHKAPKGSGSHKMKGMKKASLKSLISKTPKRKPVF